MLGCPRVRDGKGQDARGGKAGSRVVPGGDEVSETLSYLFVRSKGEGAETGPGVWQPTIVGAVSRQAEYEVN